MKIIKIAEIKVGNIKLPVDYETVASFINENSPKSVGYFDKVNELIDSENHRVSKLLGFDDLNVTITLQMENSKDIAVKIIFDYDNGRKKTAINKDYKDRFEIHSIQSGVSHNCDFYIYKEEWINDNNTSKQTIVNIDTFKNIIDTKVSEIKNNIKLSNLEEENKFLKSKIEDLEAELDFLKIVNIVEEEEA